jgi:eukaryotic-like serine/threonine-protein kinase
MTCHECGSEVAEIDVFCPFCGISLEPVSLADDQIDDSMASTIMIQPSEMDALSKAAKAPLLPNIPLVAESAKEPTGDESDKPEGDLELVGVDGPSNELVDEVPKTAEQDVSMEDIPAPIILSGANKTIDNLVAGKTAEVSLSPKPKDPEEEIVTGPEGVQNVVGDHKEHVDVTGDIADSPATAAFHEVESNEVAASPEDDSVFEPEEILNTGISSLEDEIAIPKTFESSVDEFDGSPSEDLGLIAHEPNFTEMSDDPAPAEPESPVVQDEIGGSAKGENADIPVPLSPFVPEPPDELFEARLPSNFEGIAKPLEELEAPESYHLKSTFDSVRIMENRASSQPDDVDTRIQFEQGKQVESVDGPTSDPVASESVPDEIEIPATAHNIGVGETDGKKSSKLKPLTEGTLLNGRYEIVRKIGGGGMGAVYLASDNNLGGVLRAVKEMVQTHIEEEQQEKAINDFKRESMILSSLDHVSIPTIYDYFYDEKESRFYLVMKYIAGGDLSSRLRSAPEGKIDEKRVTEWAIQIIDVLDYLHNQPSTIVYRDLKPSNIMIDGNSGRAMLIDFGIARSISQKEEKGVTAVGTMGYAPPELFSGNVEPRSDIYSLGSTMFHLLTGADPQSNPLLIFDFQKNPRPRQINPQLSDQIERIIMKSVEYGADSRFKSAAEMREILEEHLIKLKNGIVTYGVTEIPASVSLANQSVFCGFCGQRIVATDMFCAFCGAKQPIAQQGVHSEIYSQGSWTAKLVIEGTSELSAPAFSLHKDDNLLGRRDPMSNIFPEVDLSKYDPQTKISRRHARIWRDGSNFMVEDLGSSNGTILARSLNESMRLVPNQPQVLAAGDKIRVGDAILHFVIG